MCGWAGKPASRVLLLRVQLDKNGKGIIICEDVIILNFTPFVSVRTDIVGVSCKTTLLCLVQLQATSQAASDPPVLNKPRFNSWSFCSQQWHQKMFSCSSQTTWVNSSAATAALTLKHQTSTNSPPKAPDSTMLLQAPHPAVEVAQPFTPAFTLTRMASTDSTVASITS